MARYRYVKLNLRPLLGANARLKRGADLKPLYNRMAIRYLQFLRNRFVQLSAGGGEWPPLAPITVKRKNGRTSILRDTDQLLNALKPGMPGNLISISNLGVQVGIGGNAPHGSGKITISRLAEIHNAGEGRNPERQIIAPPNEATKQDFMVYVGVWAPGLFR